MPGIIGNNVQGASSTGIPANGTALISTGLYLAVANDEVDQIFFYGHNGWNSSGSIDFAVYDISSGFPNNRIGSVVNIAPGSSTSQWWGSVTGLAIALTAGVTYCIGFAFNLAGRINFDNLTNATSVHNAAGLPSSWIHSSTAGFDYSFYANVIAGSGGGGGGGSVGRPGIPFDPLFGDF